MCWITSRRIAQGYAHRRQMSECACRDGLLGWPGMSGPRRRGQYAQHMGTTRRLAVIDPGSNSFRLVVFTATEGWWQRTDEIYEAVRIGEGLAASGVLGEQPIARALATLDVFAHFCRASGLPEDQIDAVATSAIRDAKNSEQVLV